MYGMKVETVAGDNRMVKDQEADETGLQTKNVTRTYEIDLEALFADVDEYNKNGDVHVTAARDEIQTLRDRLAVLIDTEQLEGEQAKIWEDVQDILRNSLFGKLPQKLDEGYDADEAVALIDRVLAALDSQDGLEDALEEDGGGIFTEDGDPVSTKAVGDIWGEKDSQVKAWLGSTSFTRFGAWRLRTSRNAVRAGGWNNLTDGDVDGPGVFAYSPLDPTVITGNEVGDDPRYPSGATATYSGATRAIQGTTFYEGEVLLAAEWSSTAIEGSVSMEITNLRNAGNGDPLMYHMFGQVDDDLATPDVTEDMGITESRALGSLIFANITADRNTKNELMFSAMGSEAGSQADPPTGLMVRIGAVDPGETQLSLVFAAFDGDGDVVADDNKDLAEISGQFVGSSEDGPLGVIGMWEVTARGGILDEAVEDGVTPTNFGT